MASTDKRDAEQVAHIWASRAALVRHREVWIRLDRRWRAGVLTTQRRTRSGQWQLHITRPAHAKVNLAARRWFCASGDEAWPRPEEPLSYERRLQQGGSSGGAKRHLDLD